MLRKLKSVLQKSRWCYKGKHVRAHCCLMSCNGAWSRIKLITANLSWHLSSRAFGSCLKKYLRRMVTLVGTCQGVFIGYRTFLPNTRFVLRSSFRRLLVLCRSTSTGTCTVYSLLKHCQMLVLAVIFRRRLERFRCPFWLSAQYIQVTSAPPTHRESRSKAIAARIPLRFTPLLHCFSILHSESYSAVWSLAKTEDWFWTTWEPFHCTFEREFHLMTCNVWYL